LFRNEKLRQRSPASDEFKLQNKHNKAPKKAALLGLSFENED